MPPSTRRNEPTGHAGTQGKDKATTWTEYRLTVKGNQMAKRFVLVGPQGIGKSLNSYALGNSLGVSNVQYEWDGKSQIEDGTLAITNGEYVMPEGGVAFHVENADGLYALIDLLQCQAA